MQIFIILALAVLCAVLAAMHAWPLAILVGIVCSSWAVFLLVRRLLRRIIWRLRNRLMVTYVFVGAVPILLFLALATCATYIMAGQIATYLVSSELARRAASLEGPARFLSEIPAAKRPVLAGQLAPVLALRNPGYAIAVTGPSRSHFPEDAPDPAIPSAWKKNFTGIVRREGRYYCVSVATSGDTTAAIIAPLTNQVMESLVPGIGALSFYDGSRGIDLAQPDRTRASRLSGSVPEQRNAIDFEAPWANSIDVAAWDDLDRRSTVFLSVVTRPSAVLQTVFAGRGSFAEYLFLALAGLLGMVELVAIVVSTSITRTITGAVHNLYTGTRQIAHGNFSNRIPASGHDQLAELGESFNQMTEQLERLVGVAKEKERLQAELTIACEVQNQLFPRTPPPMRTIQLMGTCTPARSVSGDYYDYICLPNGNLAFAIGDVAGKGISAALLMASIQSIMRTQLASGAPSPARLVKQLNRQLHENTSPEKYATFFFGLYDESSRTLTYTNAGHLPPLIICGGDVKTLEPTGTVVGLFPIAEYEERVIDLHHDDLLIAYTDGITEPENAYGEEFGSDRMADVVLRNRASEPTEIVARVMEAVKHWSHSPEMPDDMTVLVARGIA